MRSVFDETGAPSKEFIELEGRRRDGEAMTEEELGWLTEWKRELYAAEGEPVARTLPISAQVGSHVADVLRMIWQKDGAPAVLLDLLPPDFEINDRGAFEVIFVTGFIESKIIRSNGQQPFVLVTETPWESVLRKEPVESVLIYSDSISRTGQYIWDAFTKSP